MPLFGAHMSVSGGLHNAISASVEHGCETVQLFTKNASQWNAKPLEQTEIQTFRSAIAAAGLKYPTAHDSYLINIASPKDELYERSIAALIAEVERAEALGLSYLVVHPGAHTGSGEEAGVQRAIAALDIVHETCPGFAVVVLLETTAGQGTTLGHRFEHLAAIREGVKDPKRLGVCFDTCHVFAAGYALSSKKEYAATFRQFDRTIGLKHLKVFHVNDSAKPFDSRVDRHAAIGRGEIGLEAFRLLANDDRFQNHPMILETPKESDEEQAMDRVNLGILRGLIGSL